MSIIRTPTEQERNTTPIAGDGNSTGFINIAYKEDIAKQRFEEELAKEFQKAMKKGMPFADKAARADWLEYYEKEKADSLKRNGFVDLKEIKPIKVEWSKYSDLNNFEVLEEGEVSDDNLSKHNPGLNVMSAYKKYKFKGHFHNY